MTLILGNGVESLSPRACLTTSVPWDHSAPKWWRVPHRPRGGSWVYYFLILPLVVTQTVPYDIKHRKHSWSCNHISTCTHMHTYNQKHIWYVQNKQPWYTIYHTHTHDIGCVLQFYQHEIHLHILGLSLPSDNSRSTASKHTILFHGSEESYWVLLLMEEIPNNHLGCMKPCK